MSKGNKHNNPTVQPDVVLSDAPQAVVDAVAEMSEETAENVVSLSQAKGKRANIFERVDEKLTEAAASKVKLITDAKKELAEAAKLAEAGETGEAKAIEHAARGGRLLFTGRITGVISPDEVSDILGSTFGWKGKGAKSGQRVSATEPDATRSATPYGVGEQVRKRVVRAVGMREFVNGNERAAGAFFNGLTPEQVQPVLQEVLNNNGSLWYAYKRLAEIKSEATGTRPKDAFNPKKIAAITATLGGDIGQAVTRIQGTPGLFDAYLGLYRMISVIGREMPEEAAQVA